MKKVELLVLFILFMSNAVIGQNNVFPTNGNVVINSGNLIQSGDYFMQTQGAIKLRNYLLFDSDGDFTGGNYYTIQDDPTGNYLRMGYNFNNNLVIDSTGLVGIGIYKPKAGLHVTSIFDYQGNRIAAILGNQYNDWTYFGGLTGGRIRGSNEGYLAIESNPNGTGDKGLYLNYSSPGEISLANGGGNVGIGTTSPQYKLDVIGTIRAREIKVDLNGADFVFADNYRLKSLTDVEQFIKEKKHLPGIESADKMEADGTDLGALNTKLLQKVEELTLYVIEISKGMKSLEQENINLKKQIKELKSSR